MNTQPDQSESAVQDAAERIFASGILDEIADAAWSRRLDDRDVMADAIAVARVALRLASDEDDQR